MNNTTLWLTRNAEGALTSHTDSTKRYYAPTSAFRFVKLPAALGFGDRAFEIIEIVKSPCVRCSERCERFFLKDCNIKIDVCFLHENPYAFHNSSNLKEEMQ